MFIRKTADLCGIFSEDTFHHTLCMILKDHTTGENIVYGNDDYKELLGSVYTPIDFTGLLHIEKKTLEEKLKRLKSKRTKKKGEVFTPSWLCNKQINCIDKEYGMEFNEEIDKAWVTKKWAVSSNKISWQDYVKLTRMEITCGEAPYLCSRKDLAHEVMYKVEDRIGMLDRKLRIVGENTENQKDYMTWVIESYKNTYGYELQGDNLLLARLNLLYTFVEYYFDRWKEFPSDKDIKTIANIISWNIWQMNGLTYKTHSGDLCKIMDWGKEEEIYFKDLVKGEE